MSVHDDDRSLLSELPAVPLASWRARVEQALGQPVETLDHPTVEGPTVRALYSADDGEPEPRPPARAPGWSIALEYATPAPSALLAALRHDVERGLEVAWVGLHDELRAQAICSGWPGRTPSAGAPAPQGPGPRPGVVLSPEALPSLVEALGPKTALHLDAGLSAPAMLRALLELDRGDRADAVLCDPLATVAGTGALGVELDVAYAGLAESTRTAARRRPSLRTILCDGVAVHDAGASAEQEVAFVVAAGIEHLRRLEAHGLPPTAAVPHLALRMAVGTDLLLEVAKLRAVSSLWARVRAHAGAAEGPRTPPTPLWIRSSWRGSTRRDPWVNLLRGTVAGFAAVVGGASVLAIQPFTEALGEPGPDARRWAIATQHILRGEAHLGRVDDPAAGSWTFEGLTDALARGAWQQVRAWLALGGVAAALERGALQAEVAERAAARSQALATGLTAVVGTTLYPLLDERVPAVDPVASVPSGVTEAPRVVVRPLPRRRPLEPFEELRDRNDAVARARRRPRAALVAVGEPARARAQLDFARNFVSVGGFEPLSLDAEAEPPPDVGLALLCGPPEALDEHGPRVARRLREAGVRRVLVAGRPTPALREAGVHDFVHRGRDVLALLGTLQLELLPTIVEAQP